MEERRNTRSSSRRHLDEVSIEVEEDTIHPSQQDTSRDFEAGNMTGRSEVAELGAMFLNLLKQQQEIEDQRLREETERRRDEEALQREEREERKVWERTMLEMLARKEKGDGGEREREREPQMPRAKLHKFVEGQDDIEAFLEGFEATAETEGWPKEKWTGQLVTVLAGKGLSAFKDLDAEGKKDYDTVKEHVLESYSVSADTYRLRFFENSYDRRNPKRWGRKVQDLYDKWVKASGVEGCGCVLTVIERLLQQLPAKLQGRMRE